MQNKIKLIKNRIDQNHPELIQKYGTKCELVTPIIEMIDILIKINASDKTVTNYLNSIESSLIIIEEKIRSLENIH